MSNLTAMPKDETMTNQTPLPLRNDTILGVCEAIGQDFGFNPLWLRLAFIAPIFFAPDRCGRRLSRPRHRGRSDPLVRAGQAALRRSSLRAGSVEGRRSELRDRGLDPTPSAGFAACLPNSAHAGGDRGVGPVIHSFRARTVPRTVLRSKMSRFEPKFNLASPKDEALLNPVFTLAG